MSVLRVRLTGRATRFLAMLRELGHIDDNGEAELFVALTEMYGKTEEATVDLPEIRRAVAGTLFGRLGNPAPPVPGEPAVETDDGLADSASQALVEDWPLMFS